MLCLVDLAEFLDRVEIADQTFGAVSAVGWTVKQICQYMWTVMPSPPPYYSLIAAQGGAVYLHACRSFWDIFVADFIQAEHFSRRGVELVVVDLQ